MARSSFYRFRLSPAGRVYALEPHSYGRSLAPGGRLRRWLLCPGWLFKALLPGRWEAAWPALLPNRRGAMVARKTVGLLGLPENFTARFARDTETQRTARGEIPGVFG